MIMWVIAINAGACLLNTWLYMEYGSVSNGVMAVAGILAIIVLSGELCN